MTTTAGALVRTPPRLSQPDQPSWNHLCHSALSVPAANTSRRPSPHDDRRRRTTSRRRRGSPSRTSRPGTTCATGRCRCRGRRRRAGHCAHEATAGPDVSTPPRLSQPDQPSWYHLCHSALSVPRDEHVDPAVAPRDRRRAAGQYPAEALPAGPAVLPPLVPERAVGAANEDVKAPVRPRRHGRA